jgi:hypothetical protein
MSESRRFERCISNDVGIEGDLTVALAVISKLGAF